MKKIAKEKRCSICGRIIATKNKKGLCPNCINKYGTPAALAGAGGLIYGAKILAKNKEKIAKGTIAAAKTIYRLIKK